MKSRWSDADLAALTRHLGDACPELIAHRLYSARLLGEDTSLVLHGGGNVSVKAAYRTALGESVEAVFVKASGRDLAALDADGLCPVDAARARKLADLGDVDDHELARAMRCCTLDDRDLTPSIETPLHALLPHRFVDHSHADTLVALTQRSDGEQHVRQALGDRVAIVPYVRPGPALALAVADACEKNPDVDGIVLLKHGLVTFGDDARTSYERHIELIDAVERYVRKWETAALRPKFSSHETPEQIAAGIAPLLRGALALPTENEDQPFERVILHWRCNDRLLEIVNSEEIDTLATSGPLTGDHVIRTQAAYLVLRPGRDEDLDARLHTVVQAVDRYREEFAAFARAHGIEPGRDTGPVIVLVPGMGLFSRGRTIESARVAADIAERTLLTKVETAGLGPFEGLDPSHLADMLVRPLQQAKVTTDASSLAGQIVFISGGAGAIGVAVGKECIAAGAHVALTDIDESLLDRAVTYLNESCGADRAFGVVADVTQEEDVRRAYDQVIRRFGGVDVIVPNAGIAHVSTIAEMDTTDFERVMAVNATGYLIFMREGIRVLLQQQTGGNIVISASKNVFGPGKSFGAYSASKAAGHQLGKVAAMELAEHGVRVNMINADAVFGDQAFGSGLWAAVGPGRAAARGMTTDDLPEYYRNRNLLKARVTGRHVGRAVVFFASNATPTTGATLPVDGGVVEAFPR